MAPQPSDSLDDFGYTARVNSVARFFTSFTNGGFTSRPGSAVC